MSNGPYPGGASTSGFTVMTPTTQGAERPRFDEATVHLALDLASTYFIAVRSGNESTFTALFTADDLDAARALFAAESERIKANQEAFAPSMARALWRQGDRWFRNPDVPVPARLESWLAEQPGARMVVHATMVDGSTRFFQVQLEGGGKPILLLPQR